MNARARIWTCKSRRQLPRILASWLAFAAASTAFTAAAPDDKRSPAAPSAEANTPEWAAQFGGVSLPAIWQRATAASEKITAALAARKIEGISEWAETIHLAAHALEDQVDLGEVERQKRLNGALRQTAKIADDVISAASDRKVDETAEACRRLTSALALAKIRLPKEVVVASP